MKDDSMIPLNALLERAAGSIPYPPTPDLSRRVLMQLQEPAVRRQTSRRLALATIVLLVVLAGLMAVPQVRAAVLDVLRIGAVRIFMGDPAQEGGLQVPVTATVHVTATVDASPTATPWTAGITGETTLEEAADQLDFPLQLPDYPPDAGQPNQVFLPDLGGPVAVLVWHEPDAPDKLRFALYEIGPGAMLGKSAPPSVEEVRVGRSKAIWITSAHDLFDLTRSGGQIRLIDSNVLIWEEGEITYRLETWLDKEESIRIAESLQ